MLQIVVDANNTSAHGVQDDGKGYNKVLIWLSAEDWKCELRGEVELVILKCCDTTNTWVYKYSNIFRKGNLKGMNWSRKIQNMKHKRNKKKKEEMWKEKGINCKWERKS